MKINKYFPFAFVYFFMNAVGLPFGLLYTMLLTPVFYVWTLLKGKKYIILKFLAVFTPFIISHHINGVDVYQYWRSIALFFTVYMFGYAFYTFITTYDDLGGLFKKILVINFALTIIALPFLFTPYRNLFWSEWGLEFGSFNIEHWQRLRMFTYEPSYYSTLFVPVFTYYFIKYILRQIKTNTTIIMLMVIVPLAASFSMGVISGLVLAAVALFFVNSNRILRSKRLLFSFLAAGIVTLAAFIFLLIFYSDNPFFVRIMAILAGADGSANGRTVEAFQLGYIIADLKSVWWGIGVGQLKILGDTIIKEFYHYPSDYGQVSIPCTLAETLALFGIIGIFIRLFLEVYLFFKTKVLSNYYRTILFVFIFIYQFTGSFTTNIAEYAIWILAFTNVFPQFDRASLSNKDDFQLQQN